MWSSKREVAAGDTVIIWLTRDNLYPLLIDPSGKDLNTKFGNFRHSDLVGVPYGSKLAAKHTGKNASRPDLAAPRGFIHILRPTPELWTLALPHRTQILYLADIAFICSWLGIKPGSRVVEAGTGSGSFSHSVARAIGSKGHLWSYEFHEARYLKAKEEFARHGMSDTVTLQHRNVCKDGFTNIDEIDAGVCWFLLFLLFLLCPCFYGVRVVRSSALQRPRPGNVNTKRLPMAPSSDRVDGFAKTFWPFSSLSLHHLISSISLRSISLLSFRICMWVWVRRRLGSSRLDISRALETRDNEQCPGGSVDPDAMSLSSARILTLSMLTRLVFLDLPAPWEAIEHAKKALRKDRVARICCFSPCIEQVLRTVAALNAAGFTEITMHEVLLRPIEVFQTPPLPSIAGLGEKLKRQEAKREEKRQRQIEQNRVMRERERKRKAGEEAEDVVEEIGEDKEAGSSKKRAKTGRDAEVDGDETAAFAIREEDMVEMIDEDEEDLDADADGDMDVDVDMPISTLTSTTTTAVKTTTTTTAAVVNTSTSNGASTSALDALDASTIPQPSTATAARRLLRTLEGSAKINVSKALPEVRGHTSYLTFACLVPRPGWKSAPLVDEVVGEVVEKAESTTSVNGAAAEVGVAGED
ncbi:hypothetical protein D9619_013206 [Psilocybe cf. subviscida]|uniref:tRNA (adenine(58)-N(1))-methyltransferase catalytic subunit TRM61 n=1 Tax=Psilocybe cf. subviscida TaxID=2480587 RepID=A0A8H5B6M9_9AGAR|nr:hypothetical protein D9619_013206 [Psilocybe cf. subviscida]